MTWLGLVECRCGLPERTRNAPKGSPSQCCQRHGAASCLPFSAKFVYCGTWAEVASSSSRHSRVLKHWGWEEWRRRSASKTVILWIRLTVGYFDVPAPVSPYPAACLCFALQKSLKKWQIRLGSRTWLPAPLPSPPFPFPFFIFLSLFLPVNGLTLALAAALVFVGRR